MRHDRIATIIIIILALTSLVGAQTTWYVDDGTCGVGTPGDPFCSIQTAINTAASGDTILVAAGTYFERIDFMGKDLEIIGDGPGLSTINASGQGNSAVRATTGETSAALLQGFTITGGTGAPDFGSAHGGGLFFMNGGSPRVTNCVVSGNSCN